MSPENFLSQQPNIPAFVAHSSIDYILGTVSEYVGASLWMSDSGVSGSFLKWDVHPEHHAPVVAQILWSADLFSLLQETSPILLVSIGITSPRKLLKQANKQTKKLKNRDQQQTPTEATCLTEALNLP